MKKLFLIFLIIVLIFLAGCTNQVPNQNNAVCQEGEREWQQCNQCACINGNWVCTETACTTCSGTWENGQCITQQNNNQQTQPSVKEFTVEGDDLGLYPETLTVNKGDQVKITFKVRNENVYYGGLDFRADTWGDTGKILPGGMTTVEFTADTTFTYKSYWPSSSKLKATGTINVM